MMSTRTALAGALLLAASAATAGAQTPPPGTPPPPVPPAEAPPAEGPTPAPPRWAGSFGAGLALTSGNADTSTLNVSFEITSQPKARNVVKAEALYLRGEEDGDLNVNRVAFRGRDEYSLNPKTFAFGQFEYLRDTFKDIDYLMAPTLGLGHKLIDTSRLAFTLDGGLGMKFEKNPLRSLDTAGAVTGGERFSYTFSDSAAFAQSINALWTLDDFGDALYTFKIGVTAALTTRSQLKVELVDIYKTRPPDATTGKNDVSVVTSIVYKF
jgi:putative salt-induced outer membrane protein